MAIDYDYYMDQRQGAQPPEPEEDTPMPDRRLAPTLIMRSQP